jgi:hypothetical protein
MSARELCTCQVCCRKPIKSSDDWKAFVDEHCSETQDEAGGR